MRTYLSLHPECLLTLTLSPFSHCQINPLWLFWKIPPPFFFFLYQAFFLLVLIKLARKKAHLVWAQGPPGSVVARELKQLMEGGLTKWEKTPTFNTHTDYRQCFRVMSKAADEQSMSGRAAGLLMGLRWWRGEGERNSPRRHGACLACFPASRVGAWKGAGRLHPSEKSHHSHSSTWMLFGLMDSGLTQ